MLEKLKNKLATIVTGTPGKVSLGSVITQVNCFRNEWDKMGLTIHSRKASGTELLLHSKISWAEFFTILLADVFLDVEHIEGVADFDLDQYMQSKPEPYPVEPYPIDWEARKKLGKDQFGKDPQDYLRDHHLGESTDQPSDLSDPPDPSEVAEQLRMPARHNPSHSAGKSSAGKTGTTSSTTSLLHDAIDKARDEDRSPAPNQKDLPLKWTRELTTSIRPSEQLVYRVPGHSDLVVQLSEEQGTWVDGEAVNIDVEYDSAGTLMVQPINRRIAQSGV